MLGNIQARRAVGDAPWTTNRGSTDYLRTLARMAPSRSRNFRGRLAHTQQWPTSAKSYQPVRISTEVNDVPLCGACYGCGLELAFPPVRGWGNGRLDRILAS